MGAGGMAPAPGWPPLMPVGHRHWMLAQSSGLTGRCSPSSGGHSANVADAEVMQNRTAVRSEWDELGAVKAVVAAVRIEAHEPPVAVALISGPDDVSIEQGRVLVENA